MKAIKFLSIVILIFGAYISQAQIIVKMRPVAPRGAIVIAPGRTPHGKMWVGGHWMVRGNNYYWQDGYYTNHRPGYRYIDGHWK